MTMFSKSELFHVTQVPEDTAEISVLLDLGPGTATQFETALPTQTPVSLTFVYPVAG